MFWTVAPYYIVYRSSPKPLRIIVILHASRDIPPILRQ
jgi:plasmid stabilization system protein ParE